MSIAFRLKTAIDDARAASKLFTDLCVSKQDSKEERAAIRTALLTILSERSLDATSEAERIGHLIDANEKSKEPTQ